MSSRWGDSARDWQLLDAWITREPDFDYGPQFDEFDPVCECGLHWTDHPLIHRVAEDGQDYETQVCGPNTVLAGTIPLDIYHDQGGSK